MNYIAYVDSTLVLLAYAVQKGFLLDVRLCVQMDKRRQQCVQ